MDNLTAPPPVVDMARVIAYAILDESVEWTGRQTLFVDGKELGSVPRLILCQNIGGDLKDILLFHCNEAWECLGTSGTDTLTNAKAQAEQAYRGITSKWIEMNVSRVEARAWIEKKYPDSICSFCDRLPTEYEQLVSGKSVAICNICIEEMHAAINQPQGINNAV